MWLGITADFAERERRAGLGLNSFSVRLSKCRINRPIIGWDEVGEVLKKAEGIVSWYNDLKDLALTHILDGGEVAGWKAVEGRGSRQYTDIDKAFAALTAAGIDESILYERKPLTVAKLEKALGKNQYREMLEETGLVVKEPGKPTLAPESDRRPAYTKASAVFGGSEGD